MRKYTATTYLRGDAEWHVLIPPFSALPFFAVVFYFVARGLHEVAAPRL